MTKCVPALLILILILAAVSAFADPPASLLSRVPDNNRYANQLLPAVVTLAENIARGSALERRPPQYIAISMGKDEYVYQLKDKAFIRCIKNRYETPSGRICGDFAVVRVELMDDSMKTLPPIMAWYMIYRNDKWQKLTKDDEGRFLRESFNEAELPPYAVRCFENAHEND